jgi:hypothetical protein
MEPRLPRVRLSCEDAEERCPKALTYCRLTGRLMPLPIADAPKLLSFWAEPSRCSECPFEECVLVDPSICPNPKQKRMAERDARILDLFWQGAEIEDLMKQFGLGKSRIQVIIHKEASGRSVNRLNNFNTS